MLDREAAHKKQQMTATIPAIPTLQEFEQILIEAASWMHSSVLPILTEGLLIEKPRRRIRIPKREVRKFAKRLHSQLVTLSKLNPQSPATKKKAVRLVGEIVGGLLPAKGMFKTKRTANPLLDMIRFRRKDLRTLGRFMGISAGEQRDMIASVTAIYDLSSASPLSEQIRERWMKQSIVPTLQAIRRIWKGLEGRWPRRSTEKLQRLARTYADAATAFEHLLKHYLELLSTSPPVAQVGIKCPGQRATLGLLVKEAQKLDALAPLLIGVDVLLRNAIQHGLYKITPGPARFIWSRVDGESSETVQSMTRRVRRIAGQAIALFSAEQIAVLTKLEQLMKSPQEIGKHLTSDSTQQRTRLHNHSP